jgi:hypothetical protein
MEKLVSSGQKLVDELQVTAENLNRITAEMDKRLPGLTDKMERTLNNADRAMETIGSEASREQIRQSLANLKVITTYGKIFFGTVAEKPWRLFWGGKINKLPSEEQILEKPREQHLGEQHLDLEKSQEQHLDGGDRQAAAGHSTKPEKGIPYSSKSPH